MVKPSDSEIELELQLLRQRLKELQKGPRGTKVSIILDGEWHESLAIAVIRTDTTKQEYALSALKRCLVQDGFHPATRGDTD